MYAQVGHNVVLIKMQEVSEVLAATVQEEPILVVCGVVNAALEVGKEVPALLERVLLL